MKTEKTIEAINSLITINNDRIEGYETAAKETEEQDLKVLFAQFIVTSQKCKQELVLEVSKLGGEVAQGTKISGKFFRVWMDLKAALTGKDRKAILSSCEFGEDNAVAAYNDVLNDHRKDITADQQSLLNIQLALISTDYHKIKLMRDAMVTA